MNARRHLMRLAATGAAGVAATGAGLAGAQVAAGTAGRGRTYVLIHGAWHGGWVWEPVAADLRARGHRVYAPSLTGLGDRRHLLRPGIDLSLHVEDIVQLIQMEDLQRVVLVGWSYGGMVAADVLARMPDRIGSMVYLDAFVPQTGQALVDLNSPAVAESMRKAAAEGRDVPPIPLKVFGVNDPQVIAQVTPRLTVQPVQTFMQPSRALARRPDIPHAYVRASGWPAKPFDNFLEAFQRTPGAQAHVIETSHLLMLTAPARTAEILANVG